MDETKPPGAGDPLSDLKEGIRDNLRKKAEALAARSDKADPASIFDYLANSYDPRILGFPRLTFELNEMGATFLADRVVRSGKNDQKLNEIIISEEGFSTQTQNEGMEREVLKHDLAKSRALVLAYQNSFPELLPTIR